MRRLKCLTHLEVQDDGPDEAESELRITCGDGRDFNEIFDKKESAGDDKK